MTSLCAAARTALTLILVVGQACLSNAAPPPPQLDNAGIKAWSVYQKEPSHRAFAIAPGGAWAWRSGIGDASQAQEEAIAECQQSSEITCLPFDLNGRMVLNPQRWAESLAPYPDPNAHPSTGLQRGQHFPDLHLLDAHGHPIQLTGEAITVLHFWGSWCPPCVHELPEIVRLQTRLHGQSGLRFLLVPLREPLSSTQAWLTRQKLDVPLTQAVATGPSGMLQLRDGHQYPDRQVAPAFPTTYILDRHGVILFAHLGPIRNWDSWHPILKHAAQNAPR